MDSETSAHYWSGYQDVAPLLEALRRFRMADERMRRLMSVRMGMNVTDMQALRLIVAGQRSGGPATPRTISDELGISTASTTKLLDRLAASGHVERQPHPSDRRSVMLAATSHAQGEIRDWLEQMHAEMASVARAFTPVERERITAFLAQMTATMDAESAPAT